MLTYERQNYALRTLNFYSKSDVKIVVLDASKNAINSDLITKLGNNIVYIHSQLDYISRLKSSLEIIDTPYVSLLADEEFFSLESCDSIINFLQENNEYSSATGLVINFKKYKGECLLSKGYEWSNYHVSSDNPGLRIMFHFNPYVFSSIYGVNRTEYFKKAIITLPSKNFYSVDFEFLFEQHFELAIVFLGKSKVLDLYYQFKSFELDSLRNLNDNFCELKGISNTDWLSDNIFLSEVLNYISQFINDLNSDIIKNNEYKQMCFNALINFCANEKTTKKNFKSGNINQIVKIIINRLPIRIINLLKILLKMIFPKSTLIIWEPCEVFFKANKISKNTDLFSITRHINNYKI